MEINKQIGVITYHGAYNFGSVLQSYATQQTLLNLGFQNEIIDFRTRSQIESYYHDYTLSFGLKRFIWKLLYLPIHRQRKLRKKKFNQFIDSYLSLTKRAYTTYPQLCQENFDYEILISGSDQIWNHHCCEFTLDPPESILAYFLAFANSNVRKKIAYASSIGHMSLEEISCYEKYLKEFTCISTREPLGAQRLSKLLGTDIPVVVDPTWLLDKEEWNIDGTFIPNTFGRKYLLWYTLQHTKIIHKWVKPIKDLAERLNLEVYAINPIGAYYGKGIHWLHSAGPLDFLSYLRHASLVVTDTFHGTAFSVNFNIPFYSCMAEKGSRQQQILDLCKLGNRIIQTPDELDAVSKDYDCDFSYANKVLSERREQSKTYLATSLIK